VSIPASDPRPAFAHASEAELARILDFYEVRWNYEPETFPIGWNLDGDVVESFSPDFYLPDLDLYVELTTLKQKLVRKKNRKLRRLRELYPDIRIKLFYARDFRMLLLKFGRMALVDELTGTTGQATPPRLAEGPGDVEPAVLPLIEPDPPGTGDGDDAAGPATTPRGRRRGRRRRRAGADTGTAASETLVGRDGGPLDP
jgi:hypoxanthine phosphoribosyltransferase